MKGERLYTMVYASLLLAVGMVLPFLTGQIKEVGDTLLPMHLPVLLCGFLCGPFYGAVVGGILPFLRSMLFGMPPMYPTAVWMAVELMAYGLLAGWMYCRIPRRGMARVYISLITAMLSGRVAWGIAKTALLGLRGSSFTLAAFITGGFLDAIPGIVLQLILIPVLVRVAEKHRERAEKE